MPSGSHGGSRGSHSSGGASFGGGGSSFGGGQSFGGRHRHHHGPTVLIFGHRRYTLSGKANLAAVVLLISLFCCIVLCGISGIILSNTNNEIKNIEVDYQYYQNMIARAEANPSYIQEGVIKTIYYNRECGKWYFIYEFIADDGYKVEGYTYSTFTQDEIFEITKNQSILIAVEHINTTYESDSIPMLCGDYPITADGEYIEATRDKTVSTILLSIGGVLSAGSLIALIVIIAKIKQEIIDNKQADTSTTDTTTSTQDSQSPQYCDFCGETLNRTDRRCPHCKAKIKK